MMRRFPADTTGNGNSARIRAPSPFDSESSGNRSHPQAGKSCLELLFAVPGLRRSQGRLPETESQLATTSHVTSHLAEVESRTPRLSLVTWRATNRMPSCQLLPPSREASADACAIRPDSHCWSAVSAETPSAVGSFTGASSQGFMCFFDLGSSRLVGERTNCQQLAEILSTQIATPAELRGVCRSV